jgi:hypothetical protein
LPFPFLENIGLSDAQKQQIQTIVRQRAPAPNQQQAKQEAEQFKAALSGARVDTATLTRLLTAQEKRDRQEFSQFVQTLLAVRRVLTPQQAQAAARAIRQQAQQAEQQARQAEQQAQQQGPQAQGAAQASPPPGPQLNLTQAQEALFDAAEPPEVDPRRASEGLATLLASGDARSFTQAVTPSRSADEQARSVVRAYAGLSQQQRQTLINYRPPTPQPGGQQAAPAGQAEQGDQGDQEDLGG